MFMCIIFGIFSCSITRYLSSLILLFKCFRTNNLVVNDKSEKSQQQLLQKKVKGEFILRHMFDKLILYKSRMKMVVYEKTIRASSIL